MTKLLVPCFLGILSLFTFACTPKVEVAAPSEPITINLNVKIQHEILVKVDKELDNLFKEEKGLF
ncbi:MAG: YnbE family lipoprotein [Candidatus Electrothrix scaldis]|nr:MAG: YnbE family lipoprotein [Candidatus Electrothrix sp. GW3-3]